MLKPYWDKEKGKYVVKCFNQYFEFETIEDAWEYITEVEEWIFSDPL